MELDIKSRPSHSRTVALTHYVLCVFSDSHVRLFVAPRTAARQAPLSMKFPRQEYWSALPSPPPGDLSHLEIEHLSPVSASRFFTTEPLGKPLSHYYKQCCDEHWGARVSFRSGFLGVYAQEWDCWVIWQFYLQFLKKSPHCFP